MDSNSPAGVATTLLEVLESLKANGYFGHLIAQEVGNVRCTNCESGRPVAALDAHGFRRLEGVSDSADMNIVVWGPCPACDKPGALTLGYGPGASEAETSVLESIDLDHVGKPGAIHLSQRRAADSFPLTRKDHIDETIHNSHQTPSAISRT